MNLKRAINKLFGKKETIHGHEIIKMYEETISKALGDSQTTFVEVGSQREAGSTLYLSQYCKKNNYKFITVDLNSETTQAAQNIVKGVSSDFEAVNQEGEVFLDEYQGTLGLVYLDAFDIEGDWHPSKLVEWYKKQGVELTNENCWKMHLDSSVAISKKMVPNGFVVFDDVVAVDQNGKVVNEVSSNHPNWKGKGKTAIPYLLNNGFEIIDYKRSACVLQKIK